MADQTNPYLAVAARLAEEQSAAAPRAELPRTRLQDNPYAAAARDLAAELRGAAPPSLVERALGGTMGARPGPTTVRAELAGTTRMGPTVDNAQALTILRRADQLLREGASPDIVAEVRKVARETGDSLPLAAQTYVERAARLSDDRGAALLAANPGLAKLVDRRGYADLAKDLEPLIVAEQAYAEANSGVERLGIILADTLVGRAVQRGSLQTAAGAPRLIAGANLGVALDIGATEEQILERLAAPYGGVDALQSYPPAVRTLILQTARDRYNAVQGMTEEDAVQALQTAADYYFSAQNLVLQAEGLVRNPGSQSFVENTLANAPNTVLGTLDAFAQDPVNGGLFLAETIFESAPQMLVTMLVSRGTGSLVAGATAGGVAGLSREYVLSTTQFLAERGYTISSVDDAVAVLQNAELMQQAAEFGFARAVPIAVLDALAGALSGVQLGRTAIGDAAGQMLLQGAAGAGGETLAQIFSEGQVTNLQDITIEFLAELPTGLIEGPLVAGRSFGERRAAGQAFQDRLDAETRKLLSDQGLQTALDAATAAQQALETTRAAIEETATFARDPEAVRELLEAAGDQEVSIPVQEIERLYQEGALTDDDIAYLQVEDELTQQGDLSGDVSTTASRVLTLQGDAFARLSEHVRTQPGAPTTAEAREALANREADIERLQGVLEQAQAAADEVGVLSERIAAEVRAAAPQYTAAQGRAMGRLLAERYAARAALFEPGTTAQSLYERDKVAFEAAGQAAAPGMQQAPLTDADIAYNEQVRTPAGLLDRDTVLPSDNILYRPDRAYRFIGELGYADFLESGQIRAAQGTKKGYQMPYFMRGKSSSRYGRGASGAYMVEAIPSEEGWRADEEATYTGPLAPLTSEDRIRIYRRLDDGSFEVILDNIGDRALLTDQAAPTPLEQAAASVGMRTPEFQTWFADSKVVDDNGDPLVVYHGTASAFEAFDPGRTGQGDPGFLGSGFYFGDNKSIARSYAMMRPGTDERVIEAHLSLQNPFMWGPKGLGVRGFVQDGDRLPDAIHDEVVRRSGYGTERIPSSEYEAAERTVSRVVREVLEERGYDGVIATDDFSNQPIEFVAFRPEQIKDVTNERPTAAPSMFEQTAYHGSPHLFDKFLLRAIGTGEGAQAYGWGLYFAENPEVAKSYLNAGRRASYGPDLARSMLQAKGGDYEKAARLVRAEIDQTRDSITREELNDLQDALYYLERGKTSDGRLYVVDIPEDAELLDWNAPLSKQPDGVREKLINLIAKYDPMLTSSDPSGEAIYQALSDEISPTIADSDRMASEALRAAGIPGHRYLDGGSRADGDGTHNYVIYDENRIQVLQQTLEQPTEGPQTPERGAVGAPRGQYLLPTTDDGPNIIQLTTTADPSTFVHEVGHMFLFQMLRDLQDPRITAEGRAQIEAQIAATRAWFESNAEQGLSDLKALAKSIDRRAKANKADTQLQTRAARLNAAVERANAGGGAAYMQRVAQSFMDPQGAGYDEAAEVVYHELWARGFEKYLGTGSAPSAELRGVFAKFAKYITSIYKSLRRLNVTVSPEVADVFDRLLATEDAINAERRGALYQVSPGVLEGATPAEANELRRLAAEAEDEARTQMAARVENSLRAEERAKRRARREEIANEISLQVAAEPTYAAINIAKRGVMPDGKELGTGKISRAEFLAVSDENSLARMPKGMVSGKVAPDNAIPLGDLATLAGFPDIDTMIEALTNPTPPSEADAVKSRTDAQMAQEFGADLDADALQTKAVEVAQNDKFQQLQQLQLRILRRLATQPMQRLAQRQAEQQGAPAAAADTAAAEAARAEQAAARTPREGVQAALARIRADVQRTANASQRRAQAAAGRTTRGIQRNVDPAAVEAAAERFVANLKVKDATPARYRQAASRLTTKIERAIAARNYTEASSLMEQRALNLAVAKRAAVVQSKIEQQRTRWREVTARSDKRLAQRYSIDWINAIRVMLEPFGMARSTPRNYDANKALAALASVEPTLLAEIKLTLATYGGRAQAARQAIPNAPYKDLGVQEALDMLETADTMLANARDSYGILVEGRRVEFAAISDEIAVNVGQRRKVQKQARAEARGRGTRAFRATRRKISGFTASLRRIELWARDIDNGNPRGPMTRYLVRPVMRAVDAYTEARRGPQEALANLLRGRTDLMARKPIKATELDGYVFQSKGELLMALLHTGNPSNKRKLLLGGAEDVANRRKYVWGSLDADGNLDTTRWDRFTARLFAEGTLTKADMDLVQGIWDIFEQTKKPAQAAHKQMYGYYFTEIEAEPLITPVGTYRGGYAPAVTDVMMNSDGNRFEAEEVMSQQSNAAMFPGAEKGFTQSRTEYNKPLDLDLTRIPAHFDRVMKFAYLGPAVRQAARLVTSPAFREAVRPASPDVIDVAVIPWLQRTVQQLVTTPPANQGSSLTSSIAAAIDRRVGLHVMAGNLVNAAQQVTGFSVAAARIPARHIAVAFTQWRVDNQSARAYILSRSTFMQDRLTGGMNEASTTLESILTEPGLLNKAQNAAMRYGYFAQQMVQNLVDPTVWLAAERHGMETVYPAAYAEALERTGDEAAADAAARAEVAEYADSVVRDTQAPLRPSDISGIEASSPLARIFLKFYSYFNAMGNLLVAEKNITVNSEIGWAGRYGRSFYAYLLIMYIPTVVAESISQLARGGFDDLDDEDERNQLLFEIFIGSQIKTLAATVPYFGALVSTTYGVAVTEQVYDDRINLSAGIGVTESTVTNVVRLIKAAADPDTDVDTRRAIRATLDAMGLAVGLPTGWAAKPISYAASVAEGDSDPEGLVDVIQGALTGRDGTER